jgi:hypothetical protein
MTPTYPDGTRWMVAQTGIVKYEMRGGAAATLKVIHKRLNG